MSEPNASTLVINMSKPVNQGWFTDNVLGQGPLIPMPSHVWAKTSAMGPVLAPSDWSTNPKDATAIFNFLTAQNKSASTDATNPLWQVVDGPYRLQSYNAATTASRWCRTPPTAVRTRRRCRTSRVSRSPRTTPSSTPSRRARSTSATSRRTDVPQLKQVQACGYNYFGIPVFGMTFANYNFKDKTGDFNNIVSQLYFRQVMAHLEDQPGWIKAFMHGAGGQAFGPVPTAPGSPYLPSNAASNPYPFSVSAAVALLKQHGWTVILGGTDVCASAGTGPTQCGAGIPACTKLAFNFIYSTAPAIIGQQATDLVSAAKQAGVNITLPLEQLQLHDPELHRPGRAREREQVGDYGLRRRDTRPVRPPLSACSTPAAAPPDRRLQRPRPPTNLIQQSIKQRRPGGRQVRGRRTRPRSSRCCSSRTRTMFGRPKNTISAVRRSAFESLTQYYTPIEQMYFTK